MIKKSDLKTFGLIWAGIFMLIGLVPFFISGGIRVWAILVSVSFITVSLYQAELLTKFYNIWMKIGHFIGGIVSKLMLFVLFFIIFAPVAIFLRLIGKDLLDKKIDKSKASYWIERERQPESMKNQF